MQTIISQTFRSLLVLTLFLPLFTFAQIETTAIPVSEQPAPPAFLENIQSEEDFVKLTPSQQEEVRQYYERKIDNPNVSTIIFIPDADIISQKNGTIGISFSMINQGESIQPDVRYGITLVKKIDGSEILMDTMISPEILVLKPGDVLKKEVTYVAPSSLNGEYLLYIQSMTKGGFVISSRFVGTTILYPVIKQVEIKTDTCLLQVQNKEASSSSIITKIIQIEHDESLSLSCQVTNFLSIPVTLTPNYKTYVRTLFGDLVSLDGGLSESFDLKPNESRNITIKLPKANLPQEYYVSTLLKNDFVNTNTVVAHYTIVGPSATIRNVLLDKDSYSTGDDAKMTFIWSGSNNSSALSASLNASITSNGNDCAISKDFSIDSGIARMDLILPISATCEYPFISLKLEDEQGNVLDTHNITVTEPITKALPVEVVKKVSFWSLEKLVSYVGIALILILPYLLYMKRSWLVDKTILKSLLLLLLFGTCFTGGVVKVEAFYSDAITVLTQSGTTMASYLISNSVCVNSKVDVVISGYATASPEDLRYEFNSHSRIVTLMGIEASSFSFYDAITFDAPSTPGKYNLNIKCRYGAAYLNCLNYTYFGFSAYMPVTVTAGGSCSCTANKGDVCTGSASLPNSCGQTSTAGTVQCDGSCSAGLTPANPLGLGDLCSSAKNSCGMTYTGTQQCDGSCSKTIAPPNSDCPPVVSMSASPLVVDSGKDSKLTWNVSNAVSCVGTSLPSLLGWNSTPKTPSNSFEVVNPISDVTYTLTCDSGTGNKATDSATVLHPSGSISASDCEITAGDTTCKSYLTWNTANFLGTSPLVTQLASPWSSSASSQDAPGLSFLVNPTNDVFTLKDTGGMFIRRDSANSVCATGSAWTDTTLGCLKLPELTLSVNQNIIRNGEQGRGKVAVLANYVLNCTLVGATEDISGLSTFTHSASAVPLEYSFTTLSLTSAQKVQVECVHPSFGDIKDTKLGRIDVTASIEER